MQTLELNKMGLAPMEETEMQEFNGGIIPLAIAAWWAGATLCAKIGVIAAGVAVVGTAGAIGYYNGYYDTKK